MDKEEYNDMVHGAVQDCLDDESDTHHAVLITFNSQSGKVMTYAVNATYPVVQMLVTSAAYFCKEDEEERVIN